jgi:YVTN family beta-propeller protein
VADVFISYSRRDGEFIRQLASALEEHGKDVWVDVEGIRDAEVFPEALRRAIASSDAFVFVISPDSVRSSFCVEEVEHAARLHKRIVPLALSLVSEDQVPEDVRVRNWIPAGKDDDFTITIARLVKALDTDLEWEREHSRLTMRALEWERSGRDRSFLLRGADLKAAERWLADGAEKDPGPTALETEYLAAARARVRRGRLLVAAGSVVVIAVIAVLTALLAAPGAGVHVGPNSVAAINARTDSVVASIPVGSRPGAIAFGSGSLWVANLDDQTVSRVDPKTLSTARSLSVSGPPTGLAASAKAIWVAQSNPQASTVSVNSIDPQFNAIGPSMRLGNVVPGGPGTVAAQRNTVWVAPSSGLLTGLDADGRVAARIDPNAGPAAIALGDGAVWLTDSDANNVTRVDQNGRLAPIAVGNGPRGIAVGAGGVWVADSLDDTLVRINPGTNSVTARIRVGRAPLGVAVGAGSVWVANSGDGTVSRIDPRNNKVRATLAVGGSPQQITVAEGRAWVTVDAQTIRPPTFASERGTLRIASQIDVDHMDPALAYQPLSSQVLYAVCANLLNYPERPGAAGSRLIPEVARSLPARSADGGTYTFTIRSGFRFSPPSNQPVTAQTFKDTIERTLNPRMRSPVAHYLADVVGAGPYMAGKAAHISGVVANGSTLTIHLLHPEPDFLSRIALQGFCAVPSNTPVDPKGVRVIPSAGPYYVSSYTPGQGVVLTRNPNYHGPRPRRFDRIQLAVGVSFSRAVAEVKAGTADYTTLFAPGTGGSLLPLISQLANRYGPGSKAAKAGAQQYFVDPFPLGLDYFVLNTHRPLFANPRMRQAVNYAIDRRALARLGDGAQPVPERPTDHYLPPAVPGFRAAHVYPLSGDTAKAKQLAGGGTKTAVLYTCNVPPCGEQAQLVKTALAAINLHVRVRAFPPLRAGCAAG